MVQKFAGIGNAATTDIETVATPEAVAPKQIEKADTSGINPETLGSQSKNLVFLPPLADNKRLTGAHLANKVINRPIVIGYQFRWEGDEPLTYIKDSLLSKDPKDSKLVSKEHRNEVEVATATKGEVITLTLAAALELLGRPEFNTRANAGWISEILGTEAEVGMVTGKQATADKPLVKFAIKQISVGGGSIADKGVSDKEILARAKTNFVANAIQALPTEQRHDEGARAEATKRGEEELATFTALHKEATKLKKEIAKANPDISTPQQAQKLLKEKMGDQKYSDYKALLSIAKKSVIVERDIQTLDSVSVDDFKENGLVPIKYRMTDIYDSVDAEQRATSGAKIKPEFEEYFGASNRVKTATRRTKVQGEEGVELNSHAYNLSRMLAKGIGSN